MKRYLVGYDLTKIERDYSAVDRQMRTIDAGAARILESTWLVETAYSPDQIVAMLSGADAENNDRFLVLSIEGPWAGLRLRTDDLLRKWFGPPTGKSDR